MSNRNHHPSRQGSFRAVAWAVCASAVLAAFPTGAERDSAAGSGPDRIEPPAFAMEAEHSRYGRQPARAPRSRAVAGTAGEFQPQSAIILNGDLITQDGQIFVAIVSAVRTRVQLIVLAPSAVHRLLGRSLLADNGMPADAVKFVISPAQTMWVRDYGPQFVRRIDGAAEILDAQYAHGPDDVDAAPEDAAPAWVGWQFGLPTVAVPLRLDGGNFLTNGDGLCVTSSSLVDENSERGYGEEHVRALLRYAFASRQWICLRPLQREDTHHVDMFLTFVAEDVAVVARCDPLKDPVNAAILDEAAATLAGRPTSKGPMRVYRIPMPDSRDGVWRSYTNVIFANGVLLAPEYEDADPAERDAALALYAKLLPARQIVSIKADSLIKLGGALHCIATNVPEFVPIDQDRLRLWTGEPDDPARLLVVGARQRLHDAAAAPAARR